MAREVRWRLAQRLGALAQRALKFDALRRTASAAELAAQLECYVERAARASSWNNLRLAPRREGMTQARHFLALAATATRCVLLDFARASRAVERDQHGAQGLGIDDPAARHGEVHAPLDIAEAIEGLVGVDAELARIAEVRVFGGLEHEDVAALVGCSVRSSGRRWRLARVLLERRLEQDRRV